MRLKTEVVSGIGPLAWLAAIPQASDDVQALVGTGVETGEWGLVEGVWDADYSARDFHRSPHFFGSGLSLSTDQPVIVPSRATTDRVFSFGLAGTLFVSNSLPLLAHGLGARVDPRASLIEQSWSIAKGVRAYVPDVPMMTEGSPITLRQHLYASVLVDDDGRLHEIEHPSPRSFASFEEYVSYLRSTLQRIVENASHGERALTGRFKATVSRGYDSGASAALLPDRLRVAGYTSRRSNSLIPSWLSSEAQDDDGTEIGQTLGLYMSYLEPEVTTSDERVFYAGSAAEPELVFTSMFEGDDPGELSIVVTGYHGDKVWDRSPGPAYIGRELSRGDVSGLALSEARLWYGYIHLPVPMIGAEAIESVVAISQSPVMAPWSLGTDYDRPIPRRILEEMGVPRDSFGMRKRAVVRNLIQPRSAAWHGDFDKWLRGAVGLSLSRYRYIARYRSALFALQSALGKLGVPLSAARRGIRGIPGGGVSANLHRWAIDSLAARDPPYPAAVVDFVRAVS